MKNTNKTEKQLLNEIRELKTRISDLEGTLAESKLSERKLRESDEQLRLITENTTENIAIVTFDLKATYLYINPSIKIVLGYEPEDLVGKSFFEFLHPDDKKVLYPLLKKYVNLKIKKLLTGKEAEITETVEYRFKNKKGEWRYLQSTINIVGKRLLSITRDITKRIEADNKLKESEEKFKNFVEISADLLVRLTKTGYIEYVSPRILSLYGYHPNEIIGKHLKFTTPMEEIPKAITTIKTLLSGKSVMNLEINQKDKAGKIIPMEINAVPVIKNGKIVGIQGILRDIAQRKQVEKVLQESERKYKNVIEHSNQLFYIHDNKNVLSYVSPQSMEYFGYTPEEMMVKWATLVTDNPINEIGFKITEKTLATGISQKPYNLEIKRKDGETRIVKVFESPLKDENGKVIGLAGSLEDITESKQAEEKLEEANTIINKSPSTAFTWKNEEGWPVKYVSENVGSLLGYTVKDLTSGKVPYLKCIHPDDIKRITQDVMEASSDKSKEEFVHEPYRVVTKDGKVKFVSDWTFIVRDEKGNITHYKGIIVDITERKQAEEELDKYRNHLEELVEERNKEIEAFAHSIAHDMSAPLRAINGYTKILLEEYTSKLDKEGKHLGKVIQDNTYKMGELIRGLRIFVGIGRKSMTLNNIDMKGMVKSMYYEVTNSKERERINLTIDDIPNTMGDNAMMKQVWTHLIINAIKYSSKKDKSVISVSCKEEKDVITYSIKDNGVGFDIKYVDDMFNLFRKLHVEREFEGHGVGLALIQRIIERHKGKVWAESEEDKGATFYFSLPIRKD